MSEQQLQKKDDSKSLKGICCARCYMAKTDRKKCECRCKGEHHSKGFMKLTNIKGGSSADTGTLQASIRLFEKKLTD